MELLKHNVSFGLLSLARACCTLYQCLAAITQDVLHVLVYAKEHALCKDA